MEDDTRWIEEIRALVKGKDPNFILNCDETCWRLFPSGVLTWGEKGEEDTSVEITGDEKESLTVLATISANGRKLPLMMVAKGLTEQVEESQLGDTAYHWKCHSESGWMTTDTFSLYLMHLREECGDQTIYLLLDVYACHRAQVSKDLADALDIKLKFIPAGQTDRLQPCDHRVFGALKATARSLFRTRQNNSPNEKRTKIHAVQDVIAAWERLSEEVVEEAWEMYQ